MKRPVAILNMTRMGDLLMTGPMLHRLREQWPGHPLHLIAVDGFMPIAQGMDVDRVISLDYDRLTTLAVSAGEARRVNLIDALGEFRDVIRELQSVDYEAIYNVSHTRISAIIATLLNGEVRGGLHLDSQGFRVIAGRWARNWFAGNLNRGVNPFHLVDMNIGIAGGGVFPADQRKLHYHVPGDAREEAASILESLGIGDQTPFIVVQVGASTEDKRWEPEKFGQAAAQILKAAGVRPVFVGTHSEREWAGTAARIVGGEAAVLAGQTTLPVLAAVLERSSLLVTNDTGTMHLAQAVGTRSLDITLGAALSDETGPYGSGSVILEPDIACFPCDFNAVCPHHNCHGLITPDLVASVACAMLEGQPLEQVIGRLDTRGAHIWVTGFDADGWWRKYPLAEKTLQAKDVIRECYREILKADLEPDLRPNGVDSQAVLQSLGSYDSASADSTAALQPDTELGTELLALIRRAAGLAERIVRISPDEPGAVEKLADYGQELAQLDESILQSFLHSTLWAPVLALFRFDLENLPEDGLEAQSRRTLELHERLETLVQSLLSLLADVARSVPSNGSHGRGRDRVITKTGTAHDSYDSFRRPRMRGERLNIVLPTSGYYLQQEIATALTRLGHRVHPLPFAGREDVIERLLLLSRDADLLVTVNHLGFDQFGELAHLLDRIELPYISWYVDRPAFILLDHAIGPAENALIATWEQSTIEEIRSYGFENVVYLPLATDEKRFSPKTGQFDPGTPHWVANSMVLPSREWQEKASLYDGDPLLQRAVALQRAGRLEPEAVLAAAASAEGVELDDWDKRRKLNAASAIALTATRQLRRDLASETAPLGLQLHGDQGWGEIAPRAALNPPVEYPRGLVEAYRNSLQLNATSYQMPTAVNQRVFDVPAAGGVLVTDAQEALGELFDHETECIVYTEPGEIAESIRWVRKNPQDAQRRSIRARQRILNEHTYTHRMRMLLERARLHGVHASVSTAGGAVR